MRVFALLVVACFFGFGCRRSTIVLTRSAIYKIDSVRAAMAVSGSDSLRWESYRAAADTAASWEAASGTMKSIICRAPSAGGYFQLGNILLRGGQAEEAIAALRMAVDLHYAPLSEAYCRLSAAYGAVENIGDDTSIAMGIRCMQEAIRLGCARPERFLKDQAYADLRASASFLPAWNAAGIRGMNAQHVLWQSFVHGFPKVIKPFAIDVDWMARRPDLPQIENAYRKYLPSHHVADWERGLAEEYMYVAGLGESPVYTAAVYADEVVNEVTEVADSTLSPDQLRYWNAFHESIEYHLITLSPDGSVIDNMTVAGHMGWQQPLLVFAIDSSMAFTVSKQPFHQPVGDVRQYRIAASGKFERVHGGSGMRNVLTRN